MFKIKTLNSISNCGIEKFPKAYYTIDQDFDDPDAILVRSANMHESVLPEALLAIARAGAGVNNIPLDKCSEKGIVVFNTPGANANAVKELVLSALVLSSRNVSGGIEWAKTLSDKGDEIPALVEKGKGRFAGPEIEGKTLGVIGLGAIGAGVATCATHLGMTVLGFDPFISIDSAWGLSRSVIRAKNLAEIFEKSDYITIHIPYNNETKGTFSAENIERMKDGVRILNFARGELVDNAAMAKALEKGKVSCYVTDFPNAEVLAMKNTVCIPHLGASTPESEDNCAIMACTELIDYLENGNIKNSVNFPAAELPRTGDTRVCVIHENIPNMIAQISSVFSSKHVNIENLLNKSRAKNAYTMLEITGDVGDDVVSALKAISGIIRVRVIK